MSGSVVTRRARRAGALAAIDHCLRDGPPPANPYPPGSARATYWQMGADQARSFAFPMMELRP